MRRIMLRLTEDEEQDLRRAFEQLEKVRGDAGWLMSLNTSPFLARLMLDEGKITHKVFALIGVGLALADALAQRADSGESIMAASTLSSRQVWPQLILPGPNCKLQGMELEKFISLVERVDDPPRLEGGAAKKETGRAGVL